MCHYWKVLAPSTTVIHTANLKQQVRLLYTCIMFVTNQFIYHKLSNKGRAVDVATIRGQHLLILLAAGAAFI